MTHDFVTSWLKTWKPNKNKNRAPCFRKAPCSFSIMTNEIPNLIL